MVIQDVLKDAVLKDASDIHVTVGLPVTARINGKLVYLTDEKLTPQDTESFIKSVLNEQQLSVCDEKGEVDLSTTINDEYRFRVNAFKQKNHYAAAFRYIKSEILDFSKLKLPPAIRDLCAKRRGLILVTGPTGSGKSTTLAAMIDYMNSRRDEHIITLEDPIEFIHDHKKSIVNQREMGQDSNNYAAALRAALRQDPDVILIGEMRDLETISTAITAAETGHLVLSTLHTIGAAKTIDRIIDVFPPHQQQQVKVQLSMVLQAVVSQQLIPSTKGGRVAAFEVMITTPAIQNLIREGKTPQINNTIATSASSGMISMDAAIAQLYKSGLISMEDALNYGVDKEMLQKLLRY